MLLSAVGMMHSHSAGAPAGRHSMVTRLKLHPRTTFSTAGNYSPSQIRHAYGLDTIAGGDGTGQTIAIVDAYDDPNIARDLATFDATFGIAAPPSFVKATQGAVRANAGWAQEISLDVEWAHAIAPKANILLVESRSARVGDLLTGVDYAVSHGANVVSMSWGTDEFFRETGYDYHFNKAGVTFVNAAGDSGAGAGWPGVAPGVVSVGGTTLNLDSAGNRLSEAGWSDSGGGVSLYESQPAYQAGATRTGKRSSPDVSYDADPATGFAVYDSSFWYGGGWFDIGGTSAGAPQWAGIVAIADQSRNTSLSSSQVLTTVYNHATDFNDITIGNNGNAAGRGYDLVTGQGTPTARFVTDLIRAGDAAAERVRPLHVPGYHFKA